jgi:hypothetical protein
MHGPAAEEIIGFNRLLLLNNTFIHIHLPLGIPHTEDVVIALQPCFSSVIT